MIAGFWKRKPAAREQQARMGVNVNWPNPSTELVTAYLLYRKRFKEKDIAVRYDTPANDIYGTYRLSYYNPLRFSNDG
jgi:hypothetical protein